MDNITGRREGAVWSSIQNVGAHPLFLPVCSPDLNAIGQVLVKLKILL
jgi:transposase